MAGVLTGLYAAFSASLLENAFNAMGFYRNAESFPMVGYVPLYVSLGWALTFALMPLYLRRMRISGFFLYLFLGVSWFVSHQLISWLVSIL